MFPIYDFMNNSHTSTFFQYTNKGDKLISILKEGFKFSFCKEDVADGISLGIPMISYCDIPISRSKEHCVKYGNYAIGLTKSFVINCAENYKLGPISYLIERDPREESISGLFKTEPTNQIFAFLKRDKYIHKGKSYHSYDECEWRIVLPDGFLLPEGSKVYWFQDEQSYERWRTERNNKFVNGVSFKFSIEDIEYLIVNQKSNIPNFIKKIRKLKTICGEGITDQQKDLLISKVISFEQINLDF